MDTCRPTPWVIANGLWRWSGQHSDIDDILQADRITVISKGQTADGKTRIELTHRVAMLNRRVFGYVAEINESDTTLNTSTGYRIVAVIQLVYFMGQYGGGESWFWTQTNAFSSKLMTTDPIALRLDIPITGVLAPLSGTA